MNSQFPRRFAHRGLVYEQKGDLERARADFEKAVSLSIKSDDEGGKVAQETARRRLAALHSARASGSQVSAGSQTLAPGSAAKSASPHVFGRRVALVIGNSTYQSVSALPNPQRDAETVAGTLRALGFQIVRLESDLTRERMMDALRTFAGDSEKADWAIVYFAGHGIEMGGTNYLVPIDARLVVDRDVPFEAVPLDQVLNAVDGAKRLRLVLLDACRDNPFIKQMRRSVVSRSIGRGLAQIEPEAGTLVVYAAKHGQIALDGEGENSPFVSALIKRMRTPGLEVRRLFDLVRDDVMVATSRRQQPFSYGSISGSEDFFFVSGN